MATGYCRAPPASLEVGDDDIDNDDVQLVDNFAAASLFSPNMWVQRPGQARVRRPDHANADDGAGPVRGAALPAAPTGRLSLGGSSAALRRPSEEDPELAHLDYEDEHDEELRAALDADAARCEALAALEAARGESARVLESTLQEYRSVRGELSEENELLRSLLRKAGVQKDDFALPEGEGERAAKMRAIGQRLISTVLAQGGAASGGGAPAAAGGGENRDPAGEDGGMEGSEDSGGESPAQQRRRRGAARRGARVSPGDFPAEAQIAAAALTSCGEDPAEAMLTLMERALSFQKSQEAERLARMASAKAGHAPAAAHRP